MVNIFEHCYLVCIDSVGLFSAVQCWETGASAEVVVAFMAEP